MTGLTFMAAEFNGERQYMRRAAIVANPAHPGEHLELIRHRSTGRQLGVHTVGLTIPSALLATVDELIE
jgi:putative ABC transport system substrate-binding protein